MKQLQVKHAIVGAGAMGAAAAYHLARRGEPVLLVEQFAIGHDRGSSHGAARITRHSYADPNYARLMPAAFRAWRDLEADAGRPLYVRTGGVSISPVGEDYVAQVVDNLQALEIPHRRMTGAEWNWANPAFGVAASHDVVFEPDAGMLTAAKAVMLQVELARLRGGERTMVLAEAPVRRIDLEGPRPVLLTDDLAITADRLIVSAGAWVKRLLPNLPVTLEVTRQQVLYFRPADPAPFEIGRFPVFIYKGPGALDAFYGMPSFQGLGVKVARHWGSEVDPDLEDRQIAGDYRTVVRDFLREHIPALAEAPIDLTEVCLYTVEPEERFSVDFLTGRDDVIVASPCSGHGFKFSCLIGRVLADLAADGETSVEIGPWRIDRAS
ncbi:MAG: N-methyl-L-tryptophan oxidase [Isosphaeraceae bacterium]